MKTSINKTIVAFHIGRGGRFNNAGHKSFIGDKNITDILAIETNHTFWYNRDEKGRFCAPYYADQNGNFLISEKEANTGIGGLNWDGQYDSDYCQYLSECDENELKLILESNEWNAIRLVEEFFNGQYDGIKWADFNGNYEAIISDHFNFGKVDFDEYRKQEDSENE